MRIFVTGGAGYIGSHTVHKLLELGNDILVFDNFSNSSEAVLERIGGEFGQNFQYVTGDIRDYETLKSSIVRYSPDVVVHFAGLKAVGESVESPLNYYSVNVAGSLNLLRAMDEANCQNIVFSSSATVYGEPQHLPISESHPVKPLNPYGHTKLAAEFLISDWTAADDRRRSVILRYFNPAGAIPEGFIGENPKGRPDNLMPFITQVARGVRETLQVFGDDYDTVDGTGVRDYLHVVDLADAHCRAIDFMNKTLGSAIFNLGTGKGYSVLEVVSTFQEVTGRNVAFSIANRRPGDAPTVVADPTLANSTLGWEAKYDLSQMCKDAWNWQQKQEMDL